MGWSGSVIVRFGKAFGKLASCHSRARQVALTRTSFSVNILSSNKCWFLLVHSDHNSHGYKGTETPQGGRLMIFLQRVNKSSKKLQFIRDGLFSAGKLYCPKSLRQKGIGRTHASHFLRYHIFYMFQLLSYLFGGELLQLTVTCF